MSKLLLRPSSILMTGIALLSIFNVKSNEDAQRASDCHSHGRPVTAIKIRDKNVGFQNSPVSVSSCLNDLAVTGATTTIYRNAVAEPSIAVNPNDRRKVIIAFEQGVIGSETVANLGALTVGISYSRDGGKHWNHSHSLDTQICDGGFADTVSNIQVSYASNGKAYLTATFANVSNNPNTLNQSGVFVSVSEDDGKTWSYPTILDASSHFINEELNTFPLTNNVQISVDPNNPNNVYAVWTRAADGNTLHSNSIISRSTNGGLTWSDNAILYNPSNDVPFRQINNGNANNLNIVNNQLITLPNGTLLNFMTRTYAAPGTTNQQFVNDVWPYQYRQFDIAVTRSTDNGATWSTTATPIAMIDGNSTFTGGYTYSGNDITGGVGTEFSTQGSNQFFDVAINPQNGRMYVVYQSGEFSANQLPQIALISSRDNGMTWSQPVRVSTTPLNSPNPQAFTPAISVSENGIVGLLYQDFRNSDIAVPNTSSNTKTDVWFAQYRETNSQTGGSTGVGLDFINNVRISSKSYNIQAGPIVAGGVETNGNYQDLVTQGNNFYAAYVKTNKVIPMPTQTLVNNPQTNTVLILDDNRITSPYFSRINTRLV